ncbi:hypothetical protein L6164_017030 [Bauhinia variegata]|uniref:Uncharacterized protein n=1 Tax=Bauhinia variegata TaxID=167791 RepID=A0ACB9N6T6_BAUVA|nr:hypothetical protein L6164_017030 [Bauhinia variegata]
MPQELPGFYFDEEKNRYFPIKGPIPGSARSSSSKSRKPSTQKSATSSTKESYTCKKLRNRTSKLLLVRELYGDVIASHKRKCSFKEEIHKIRASKPVVWKYQGTERIGVSALEQILIDVQTLEGQSEADVLLTGSISGPLIFCEVGKFGQHFYGGVKCMPDCVRHYAKGQTEEHDEMAGPIFRAAGSSLHFSGISCIRLCQESSSAVGDGPNFRHVLFTTLGSETSGGSIYTLNLSEPLDIGPGIPNIWSRISRVASFNCTLWNAECDYNRHRAVIGTNLGAASVDLETGRTSWFLRCKSDVFAQQFVNSGNVILCGLRNGAIITVDFRQKRERFSSRLVTHRIPYPPDKTIRSSNKEWFKLTGDIYPSHTIRMPSSISCLVSLQYDDQYFLASSMDGSIKLYDHRLLKRGAVQSYEGHVNSHSRIQLGVDPAERFVMAGGEDCKLRLWSIKSGELLFEDKFSDSVLSTVCYRRYRNMEDEYKHNNNLGAWLGSPEGLFYMHWK